MARGGRKGTPEERFHRADGRIPLLRPPGPEDGPVDGPGAVRKINSAFSLWMLCPLARCRRARLCLTHEALSACRMANREALRPHFASMRAALDRAMAERERAPSVPGRGGGAARGEGARGPGSGAPAPHPPPGPAGRRG